MAERERIARYFAPLTAAESGSFSLSDDAAVITQPAGHSLVFTTDSVIESIHILADATPTQFAQKLIRRNLSDLAAMGATPWRYLLNMHTPAALPDVWFAEFSSLLAAEQCQFGMVLIGGDSTSGGEGSIHLTMTCIGLLNTAPLSRAGARPGDDLYVSGTIGDAALGLQVLQQRIATPTAAQHDFLTMRFHLPQPRLALGSALHSIATSCIDISDGLLADATQTATASRVGLHIHRDAIPLSDAAKTLIETTPTLWEIMCTGGDDYELLFTAPADKREAVEALSHQLSLPLTRIGVVVASDGVALLDETLKPVDFGTAGWEHH